MGLETFMRKNPGNVFADPLVHREQAKPNIAHHPEDSLLIQEMNDNTNENKHIYTLQIGEAVIQLISDFHLPEDTPHE